MSGDNLEAHGLAGLEIHRAIAESSSNSLLRSVTGIVELTLALALKSLADPEATTYRQASLSAHSALLLAIEKGEISDAQGAMEQIIALDEARIRTLTTP